MCSAEYTSVKYLLNKQTAWHRNSKAIVESSNGFPLPADKPRVAGAPATRSSVGTASRDTRPLPSPLFLSNLTMPLLNLYHHPASFLIPLTPCTLAGSSLVTNTYQQSWQSSYHSLSTHLPWVRDLKDIISVFWLQITVITMLQISVAPFCWWEIWTLRS